MQQLFLNQICETTVKELTTDHQLKREQRRQENSIAIWVMYGSGPSPWISERKQANECDQVIHTW